MAVTGLSWRIATARLAEALGRTDAECGVAETILAIAIGEYPRLDVAASLQRLDAFAREVRDLIDGVAPRADSAGATASQPPHGPTTLAARQIAALNAVLFAR